MNLSSGTLRGRWASARMFAICTLLAAALLEPLMPIRHVLAAGSDNLATASDVGSLASPFTDANQNTAGATRETNEVGGFGPQCNFPLSPSVNTYSVWYKYTAGTGVNGWVTANTKGSGYDTVLEVFSGSAPDYNTLTAVVCNDDAGASGGPSDVTFQVTSGTTYYMVIRSWNGTVPPSNALTFSAAFSSQRQVFVDQLAGGDGNTGSAAFPFKTIQRGVTVVPAGGQVNIVTGGSYGEQVTIDKALTLYAAGAVTANSFTLASGADVTLASGSQTIDAPLVNVQAGAKIQNGIDLAAATGMVNVGAGTYNENLSIGKSLTLQRNPGSSSFPQLRPGSASTPGITISNGSVKVAELDIQNFTKAILVSGGSGAGHTIVHNNIVVPTPPTDFGLDNTAGAVVAVDASQNWWGALSGPYQATTNAAGAGAQISDDAGYRPWCGAPLAVPVSCTRAGKATKLVVTTSPANPTAAGAPLSVVVQAEDDLGNVDAMFGDTVALAFAPNGNTAGGTLLGTSAISAISGVATFGAPNNDVNITKAGKGYILRASSGALLTDDTAPFDITAAAADHLDFSQQPPTSSVVNASFQAIVKVVDKYDNLVENYSASDVTLALMGGTAGATLTGGGAKPFTKGEATFNLSVDKVGNNYQLVPSLVSGSLPGTNSTFFEIAAAGADHLDFTVQPPASAIANASFTVQVGVFDQYGNQVTSYNTGSAQLTLTGGTAGAALAGGGASPFVNGQATFSVSVDKVGNNYQLVPSLASGSLPGMNVNSSLFNVQLGTPDHLDFSQQPVSTTANTSIPITVKVVDQYGNVMTSYNTGSAQLALTGSDPTAQLAGGGSSLFVNGEATFSVSVDKIGSYQLVPSLTSGSLPGMNRNSATFSISAGTADHLVFSQQPVTTKVGSFITVKVKVVDQSGNWVSNYSADTARLTLSGGTAGANLSGSGPSSFSGGEATFSISIDKIGLGYQLTPSLSSTTLPGTSQPSNAFDITAAGLAFTVQPTTTPAGQVFVVKVAAQDASGNIDTSFQGSVTLSLETVSGPTRTPLYGTLTANASGGVADYTGQGLNIQKVGTGYVIRASAAGLANATSNSFDIIGGAATQLVFTTSPVNTPATGMLTPVIEARDAFGNLDPNFTGAVALSIGTNPGGGTLGGTVSKAAVGGVASFGAAEGLNINKVGVGYVLHAASGSLTAADSTAFNITASRLVFSVSPGDSPVGWPFIPQPVVRAEDGFGNLDTTFTGVISLTIASGTGTAGAVLKGTTMLAATGGVATFSQLSIDRIGTAFQLNAVSPGLSSAIGAAFDITSARVFLPVFVNPPYPDLVGSFTLSSNTIKANEPVVISVTITNQGEAPAGQFWADFYINPATPPTAANLRWDKSCGNRRCPQGIAWYVEETLAPGESITLTSTPGSYEQAYTDWNGKFDTGRLNLYLYVDSWNPGLATGAVYERNEANNRAEFHTPLAIAGAPAFDGWAAEPMDLPPLPDRPARPKQAR